MSKLRQVVELGCEFCTCIFNSGLSYFLYPCTPFKNKAHCKEGSRREHRRLHSIQHRTLVWLLRCAGHVGIEIHRWVCASW